MEEFSLDMAGQEQMRHMTTRLRLAPPVPTQCHNYHQVEPFHIIATFMVWNTWGFTLIGPRDVTWPVVGHSLRYFKENWENVRVSLVLPIKVFCNWTLCLMTVEIERRLKSFFSNTNTLFFTRNSLSMYQLVINKCISHMINIMRL